MYENIYLAWAILEEAYKQLFIDIGLYVFFVGRFKWSEINERGLHSGHYGTRGLA